MRSFCCVDLKKVPGGAMAVTRFRRLDSDDSLHCSHLFSKCFWIFSSNMLNLKTNMDLLISESVVIVIVSSVKRAHSDCASQSAMFSGHITALDSSQWWRHMGTLWLCIIECYVFRSHCRSRPLTVMETHSKRTLNLKPSFWPLWNVTFIYLPNVSVHLQWEKLYEITQRNPMSGLAFFLGGVCEGCGPKPEGNCSGPAIRWTQGAREFPTE